MPLQVRALIVVLVLCGATFWFMRSAVCHSAIGADDFRRRVWVWITVTVLAFLIGNYWLFVFISVPLFYWVAARDTQPYAAYLFLLLVLPPLPAELPTLGVFGRLLQMDHMRWLALAILLPAYLSLRRRAGVEPFGRLLADKFVLGYLLLWLVLQLEVSTPTNVLRIAIFQITDLFLPYYVASRALRNLRDYRDAVMSLVVAIAVMTPVAVFENLRYWLLYNNLADALGLPAAFGNYLSRGERLLRAIATTGHPIALGYMMAVALGLAVYLRPLVPRGWQWWALLAALFAALVAALSRGPWVGAAAAVVVLLITGPKVMSKMALFSVFSVLALPLLMSTDAGQKILDYLPFVGTVEARNVEFRQRLFEVSMQVFWQNPLLGSLSYLTNPVMDTMRGNDGLIDMVNTYLVVALTTGMVGLVLFVGPFVVVGGGILLALWRMKDTSHELHLLGRALLAAQVAILVSIATVSPIVAIPAVYLAVVGMGAGYLRMVGAYRRVAAAARQDAAGAKSKGAPDAGRVPGHAAR